MKRLASALSGTLFLLSAASATAQDFEKVQQHYDQGVMLYNQQQYDAAIGEFQKGYALYPDPVLLYNISMAHGKLGRTDQSLAVAELADSTGLEDPDKTQNLARIAALKQNLSARNIATSLLLSRKDNPNTEDTWLDKTDWKFWSGAGAVGLGLGSLIVGGVIDSGISDTIEAYEAAAQAGETSTYVRLRNNINDDQAAALGLYVFGGLLVAGGATLMTLSVSENQTFAVTPTTGGGLATFQSRF